MRGLNAVIRTLVILGILFVLLPTDVSAQWKADPSDARQLSLIHISEPTRLC